MATKVGDLIAAIGAKVATAFPGSTVIYGLPDASGSFGPTGPVVYVHYMQEKAELSGNQVGGAMVVNPVISVSVWRPFTGTSIDLASQQAKIEMGADLRASVFDMIMDHLTGVATIAGFAGEALWITDYTSTPSCLDIGLGQSTESVTCEFTFKFSSTYGSR